MQSSNRGARAAHRVDELVRNPTTAIEVYLAATVDADEASGSLLIDTADLYRSLDMAVEENEFVVMRETLATATRGISPATPERVPTRRREMERTVVNDLLRRSSNRLRQLSQLSGRLGEAREGLLPLVLVAVHRQVITKPTGPIDQAVLDALWAAMTSDPELRTALQQLAMRTSVPDRMIVLDRDPQGGKRCRPAGCLSGATVVRPGP